MEDVVARLERVAARLEAVAGGNVEVDEEVPPEGYLAMKEVFDGTFKAFCDSWAKCGDGSYDVANAELAPNQMKKAFECILNYLSYQNKAKKPTPDEQRETLAPLFEAQQAMEKLTRTRDKQLRKFDDHHVIALRIVEGFTFVLHYPPSLPKAHFASCAESAETKMLKFWKKGTDGDKEMRKAGLAFLKPIPELIAQHYKVGVEFRGKDSILSAEAPPTEAPAKAPKKADPAKEEEVAPAKEKKKEKTVDGDALLGQLTQGGAITAGLKKVKKSQKNKYNKEKIKGTVSAGPSKAKIKKKKEAKIKKAGPFTWQFFDFQNKELEEVQDEKYTLKTQLYFADCVNSNFRINSKVKSITLDSCRRVQIEIKEDLISSLELVNCKNVTVWCLAKCPTISIEKCDSPKLFLGDAAWSSLEEKDRPTIMYSMCSAGNVVFANGEEQKEVPLPEQFIVTGMGEDGKAKITTAEHGD